MNIKDFELDEDLIPELPGYSEDPGYLSIIFARQNELMEKYHVIEANNGAVVVMPHLFGVLDDRRVQIRIKDMMERVIEELMEAANTLKNKPWKQDAQPTDAEHFYEELSDAFHFFVELCILVGMSPKDLFGLYFSKSEVNKFRQRSGY